MAASEGKSSGAPVHLWITEENARTVKEEIAEAKATGVFVRCVPEKGTCDLGNVRRCSFVTCRVGGKNGPPAQGKDAKRCFPGWTATRLRVLDLNGIKGADDFLKGVFMPSLNILDLSNTDATDEALAKVLEAAEDVHRLVVVNCPGISRGQLEKILVSDCRPVVLDVGGETASKHLENLRLDALAGLTGLGVRDAWINRAMLGTISMPNQLTRLDISFCTLDPRDRSIFRNMLKTCLRSLRFFVAEGVGFFGPGELEAIANGPASLAALDLRKTSVTDASLRQHLLVPGKKLYNLFLTASASGLTRETLARLKDMCEHVVVEDENEPAEDPPAENEPKKQRVA